MRSIPLLAATTVILAAAWSCGGGGTDVTAPVANFTVASCTANAPCQFTNTSTPATGLTYDWDFGDGTTPHSQDASPAHTYTAPGTYSVVLTVKDASGATNAKTTPVTVAAAAGPVADFTVQCDGPACSFTDASTPAGSFTTYAWTFGDNTTANVQNPAHTYTLPSGAGVTPFTVTLTVTDASGATATTSKGITVTPPAQLSCGTGQGGQCTLDITNKATLTFTLTTRDCQLGGNRLAIAQPVELRQTIFFNGCSEPVGKVYTISNGAAIAAGTQILLQFTQGAGKPTDPQRGPPLLRLSGGFASGWTLEIDDGGNFGAPGEPDYNDLVLAIKATPAP